MSFSFSEKEIKIINNFATINPSIIFEPDKLQVINISKSVVGTFKYEKPYEFEPFAIYECTELLTALAAMNEPKIDPKDKYLSITDKDGSKLKYFTTANELIPKVPNVSEKFNKLECELIFNLTSENLAVIHKMASILKSKYIFFESDNKKVRITVADELETSANNYEITVDDGIVSNKLTEPVKINLSEFKILPGEYEVKISTKITSWTSLLGPVYYITTAV